MKDAHDPFNLQRFLDAQRFQYEDALSEIRRGRKRTHWIWFIFPQIEGLGSSPAAQKYAIGSLEEAGAYLAHPDLGPRLVECCKALLAKETDFAEDILGDIDSIKLRSSMTLFSLPENAPAECGQVLEKFFSEEPDSKTLELLAIE